MSFYNLGYLHPFSLGYEGLLVRLHYQSSTFVSIPALSSAANKKRILRQEFLDLIDDPLSQGSSSWDFLNRSGNEIFYCTTARETRSHPSATPGSEAYVSPLSIASGDAARNASKRLAGL